MPDTNVMFRVLNCVILCMCTTLHIGVDYVFDGFSSIPHDHVI